MQKKPKLLRIFIYLNLLAFIGLTAFLIFQASLDGKASSAQSGAVGGEIADVINNSTGDQTQLISPTAIEIINPITQVYVGDTYAFQCKVLPENATYKSLTYTVSDDSLAKISESGEVVFLAAGEVTITIASEAYPIIQTKLKINIVTIPLETIETKICYSDGGSLIPIEEIAEVVYLQQYGTYYLDNTFYPENAVVEEVKYLLNNNDEHISLSNGIIYAMKPTDEPVILEISTNGVINTVQIMVNKDETETIPLTGLSVSTTSQTLAIGQKITYSGKNPFGLSYIPEDATNKMVEYVSSDNSVVSVSGGKISALKKGTATITISSKENPDIKTNVTIYVKEINVTSFTAKINNSNLKRLAINKTYQVNLSSFKPTNASVVYKKTSQYITYTSSNTSVAKINSSGKITTCGVGSAQIKVTINQFDDDGALKGVLERVIDITVYQPSEVDDFTFITSFDEEVPVLYNNQTYEKFKDNFAITDLYFDGNVVNDEIAKTFTLEYVGADKEVDVSYDTSTDQLILNCCEPAELFFTITHTVSGVSKNYSIYCIGEVLIEENLHNVDLSSSRTINYELSTYVSDVSSLLLINTSQPVTFVFSNDYEKMMKILDNSLEGLVFENLTEGVVEIQVIPTYEDIVFEKYGKIVKINIRHKLIEDFLFEIHDINDKLVELEEIPYGGRLHCYNQEEYVIDINYLPWENPTKVDLHYEVDHADVIEYRNGHVYVIGAGSALLTITDRETNVTHQIEILARNIIKLNDKTPYKVKQEYITFDEENDEYHIRNGHSGSIINYFTEDSTFKTAKYESSNTDIIIVGSDGVFTPVKAGKASITVTISDGVSEEVKYTLDFVVEQLNFIQDLNSFLYKVRKSIGHFGAFLVLGVFATFGFALLFDNKKWLFSIPLIVALGFGVAGLTEYIQTFVPGRYGCWDDVWLDFVGYMSSTVVLTIIIFIIYLFNYLKKRKKSV